MTSKTSQHWKEYLTYSNHGSATLYFFNSISASGVIGLTTLAHTPGHVCILICFNQPIKKKSLAHILSHNLCVFSFAFVFACFEA